MRFSVEMLCHGIRGQTRKVLSQECLLGGSSIYINAPLGKGGSVPFPGIPGIGPKPANPRE